MKILIVTQYFWPESFIVNGLVSDLVRRGYDVQVLTGLPNYPHGKLFDGYNFLKGPWREMYGGATVHRVPLRPRYKGFLNLFFNYISFVLFASFFGIFKIRNKPDVIFCFAPSPVTACIPAIVLKWIFRKPLSFWVQDLWPESLSAVGLTRKPFILNAVGALVRFIYSQCDQILIQSDAFRNSVLKWGARSEQVHCVPNWSPEVPEPKERPLWLRNLPAGFRIVFAGNIGKAQNLLTLLETASLIKKNYSDITDIHWLIVGDGSERAYVESEIEKRGLRGRVHTYGQKPQSDMSSLYREVQVLYVSLKDDPIFALTVPSKVQNYLSSGQPILASINGEGARLIQEAKAGLVAPASDPVILAERVVEFYSMASEARLEMGKAGRTYFEKNFRQEVVILKLIDLWKKLT